MRISSKLHAPWQTVTGNLTRTLQRQGFEALKSFDLQMARKSMTSNEAIPCPHHGTAACTCQYLVLQITRRGRIFTSIVVHGHDRVTNVSMPDSADDASEQAVMDLVGEALRDSRKDSGTEEPSAARSGAARIEQGRRSEEV
jgi:hypothetical protein